MPMSHISKMWPNGVESNGLTTGLHRDSHIVKYILAHLFCFSGLYISTFLTHDFDESRTQCTSNTCMGSWALLDVRRKFHVEVFLLEMGRRTFTKVILGTSGETCKPCSYTWERF